MTSKRVMLISDYVRLNTLNSLDKSIPYKRHVYSFILAILHYPVLCEMSWFIW